MKFSVATEQLVSALSTVTHALPSRSTMPILEGILIETVPNSIVLTCSDAAMTISTRIAADIEEEGAIVMPGRLFGDVVRKLSGNELLFSCSANMIATIRCGGSRTTMAGKNAGLFPQLPNIDETQRVALPQPLFRDMIQQTSFAVSTDENRKILTGCLLEINGGEIRMVAIDGFRLAVRISAIDNQALPLNAVIPSKLLQELSKIAGGGEDDEITLIFGGSQLMAEMGDTKVYASLLEGEYIKYRQIIPASSKTTVRVLDREQMAMCVERASLMARESKTNQIKLTIGADTMVITSNSEMGDVYEEVQVETEGEGLEIAFNVKYVSDVLKALDEPTFLMKFNSGVSPCVVSPVEGGAFTYMILPLRLNA